MELLIAMEEDNKDNAQEGFISRWSKKKSNNKSDIKVLTEKENVNKMTNLKTMVKHLYHQKLPMKVNMMN